jgi:anti-sigma factor RsiW
MFSCKDSIDLLVEYLDGNLSEEMRSKLESHFAGCTPCEDFLRTYRATPNICRHALRKKMPEEVANKLVAFLRAEIKGQPGQ